MEPLPARISNVSGVEGIVDAKPGAAIHEEIPKGTQHDADVLFVETFPEEKRKAIVRKLDWRLPPVLASLYCK